VSALPKADDPRSLFRQGLDASHRGEYRALHILSAAQRGFTPADPRGYVLCAAAQMLTGQALSSYRGFRDHIATLAPLRDDSLRFDDRDDELLAYTGLLAGLLMLGPDDPYCATCVARMLALLELDVDVNLRFAAGRVIGFYAEPREARELVQRVYGLLQPSQDRPELTPYRLGRWLIFWIGATAYAKDPTQHERARRQAVELAEQHGEPDLVIWLAAIEINAALPRSDFARIASAMATVERVSDPANLSDMRRIEWLKARVALAGGEGDAALFHAVRCRKYAEQLEIPPPMFGVCTALEAQARVLTGDLEGARTLFRETVERVVALHAEEMRDMVRMVDAYEALRDGRTDARALLAAAFAAPRARQFYDSFDTNPRFGATMCALALEEGVEPEFVGRIVELNAFAPPEEAGANWPWPVKLQTLGRFELVCAGESQRTGGKTQRKPRELLKALVACGGRGVHKSRLADFLWPDAESEDAAAALEMAISRLRKLLGDPRALLIEDGKIGLDPARVWLDVWAFDGAVDELQRELRGSARAHVVDALVRRVLQLYRGPFLENEAPEKWLLPPRDRWRNRFVRTVADAGQHWERLERWSEAARLYERGLEADLLGEDLYRRLMRCHLAQGRPADAAGVYRRCRDTLAMQLGIPPSPATETLFQSIYARER
jgi:DNA-binding SARP family transcriptional activator